MSLADNVLSGFEPRRKKDEDEGRHHDLIAPVGRERTNHKQDVATVERALGAAGYLDPVRAVKPTGLYDKNLETSVVDYQQKAKLKQDGLLNPPKA
jgi:peptidoglycan hydrolase-like protein with peptidoglycan-binding domain